MLLIIGSLLLPLGCGSDSIGPEPFSCGSDDPDAIARFEDARLERAVKTELELLGMLGDLTCGRVGGLTTLRAARYAGITSLAGIQNLPSLTELWLDSNSISDISVLSQLTSLTRLQLSFNSITDISALSGLTGLTSLTLHNNSITDMSAVSGLTSLTGLFISFNSITDISALSGLTSLGQLVLSFNSITDISALSGLTRLFWLLLGNNPDLTDIQPLLDNTGLVGFKSVFLTNTNVSCADVATLEAKGVMVTSDCP